MGEGGHCTSVSHSIEFAPTDFVLVLSIGLKTTNSAKSSTTVGAAPYKLGANLIGSETSGYRGVIPLIYKKW